MNPFYTDNNQFNKHYLNLEAYISLLKHYVTLLIAVCESLLSNTHIILNIVLQIT